MSNQPLVLFLARELRNNKVFNTRNIDTQVSIHSWASVLAQAGVKPGDFPDVLSIARALPLPQLRKEQQMALELAAFLLPSRALWSKRSAPHEELTASHEEYWKEVDAFLGILMAQPGIDPLSTINSPGIKNRVDLRKVPLALALMELGYSQLMEQCTKILPHAWRAQAVEACAQFNKIELAEKLLADWDPQDAAGLQKARDSVWTRASLRFLASSPHLPGFDPPMQWWRNCIGRDSVAAANHVIEDRPHLGWCLTNAYLTSGRMEHLLALRMRGGLDARSSWVSHEGWDAPALGLVVCGYVETARTQVFNHANAQDFGARLNLIKHLIPVAHQSLPDAKAWDTMARWIFAAGKGVGEDWAPKLGTGETAMSQMQDCANVFRQTALTGDIGQPSLPLLTPIVYALYAAAMHDANGEHGQTMSNYLSCALPWLRALGSVYLSGTPSLQSGIGAFHRASELLCVLPVKEQNTRAVGSELGTFRNKTPPNEELEVLLWRVAFQRLKDRGKSRSFPKSAGPSRATWEGIRFLLAQGALPQWSSKDAKTLLDLTAEDDRMPEDLRAFIQAQALRDNRQFAPGKPRRI